MLIGYTPTLKTSKMRSINGHAEELASSSTPSQIDIRIDYKYMFSISCTDSCSSMSSKLMQILLIHTYLISSFWVCFKSLPNEHFYCSMPSAKSTLTSNVDLPNPIRMS